MHLPSGVPAERETPVRLRLICGGSSKFTAVWPCSVVSVYNEDWWKI